MGTPITCLLLCPREMALSILAPPPPPRAASALSRRSLCGFRVFSSAPSTSYLLSVHTLFSFSYSSSSCANANCSTSARASGEERGGDVSGGEVDSALSLLDEELLRHVSAAKDAEQALDFIAQDRGSSGPGVIGSEDCHSIIEAAFDRGDADLALSVFNAMRSSFVRGTVEKASSVERWTWARPDVRTYALMVQRLAASLQVSDAIRIISYISRMGVSSGEEVPFGMVIRCPICMVAVAVVQPQHGIQVASCSQCRYQYELVSGDIVSIESEEISVDISQWEKALRFLQINKDSIPAALHSIVVCTPSGTARTHKFATGTVELPAQEGERVTISLTAPSNLYREMGPLKLNARSPGFSPGEAMSLTNHTNGKVSQLLRAPAKSGNSFFVNPYILLPSIAVLSSGDAMSAFIDPSFPRLVAVGAVTSVAMVAIVNRIVLPNMRKLPQKTVDAIALKQQLLSQYDLLQARINELRQAAEKEVWMLARMCQLENKIVAVGEPSYRARRSRVKKGRKSLEGSLLARIELIENYAKISSMIEIEVEMDSDVLAAEAVGNAESIAQQIQQIMEIESLEERWRLQAEANDEVERLLSSQEASTELV